MDSPPSGLPPKFIEELYAIPGNRVALRHLINQVKDTGITVFAGYGVSEVAGYPSWTSFLHTCRHHAAIDWSPDEGIRMEDRIIERAGAMYLYDAIEETYGFAPSDPSTWHGALNVLPHITPHVITLNFDNAIEWAYSNAAMAFQDKCGGERLPLPTASRSIWKLFGTVEDRSTWLVSAKDIDDRKGPLSDRIRRHLAATSLLFVGVDHTHFKNDWLLSCITAAGIPHYALLENSDSLDPKQFSKLNIRVVKYPDFSGFAFDIQREKAGEALLLRHLIDQTPGGKRPVPPKPSIEPPVEPPPRPVPVVPQELIDSCRNGECVLFAGAGLSSRAGAPTWNHFLASLLKFAQEKGIVDASFASSIDAALKEGERDAAADGLVQAFTNQRQLLQDFLRQSFPEPEGISPAHEWLRQIPFATAVTTNYDRLLEVAFPEYAQSGLYTPKDAESLLDALSQKRRFILKLYGLIEQPETLIFAPIEYREAVSSNVSFSKFMEGFFFSRNFFFVGMSLEGIQDFLSGFVFRGTSPRKHFALVATTGAAWKAKADLLERRYNVQIIPIPISPTFPEVDEFLEKLSHAARPIAPEPGAATVPTPGIRRLILEDIGPFEKLELDFDKNTNWKILLGDNGVGKSTILKAIATAIIGSDARSYAARLVRAGKTRGRITLITDQNPSGYITDILIKDMVSEAEIVSIPSRPMEAEGWLALGFSPLRVVTWTPSTGPQAMVQKGRPTADDLIPLLSGESDPRMDRLKQWIVNLDAAERQHEGHREPVSAKPQPGRVASLTFRADGQYLGYCSGGGKITIFDVRNGAGTVFDGPTDGVAGLALAPDGNSIIYGTKAGRIRIEPMPAGEAHALEAISEVRDIALSHDGNTLVSGSSGGTFRLWDLNSEEKRSLGTHNSPVKSVGISADGMVAVCFHNDGTIRLVSLPSGNSISTIPKSGQTVAAIALSADGKTLVTANDKDTITVWDVATATERLALKRSTFPISALAISADGKTIMSASAFGTILVIDLQSENQALKLRAKVDHLTSIALSPDGVTAAAGSEDGTIRLWNLKATAQPPASSRETIHKFFRLVGELTDRTEVEFLRVAENFRVLVTVGNVPGGVPMEVLSQGMTSLFGWIGVLCQRLKETLQNPTNDPLPTNSFALVLIDELDAHMHPRWQQVLVHRLKKAFPNVQFIACTHSPLIVGGLDKKEVDRFTLTDGNIVKVDFDADMTLGRTDQILTGELFDLSTTLDPVTQELMAEYKDLLGSSNQTTEQKQRLLQLGHILEARIPPSPSLPLERRARELVESLQSADLSPLSTGDRQIVETRIAHLNKLLTRRPNHDPDQV